MGAGSGAPREQFFELSRTLLAVATEDGRLEDANPAWAAHLGPVARFHDVVHADSRASADHVWARVVEGGAEYEWSVDRFIGAAGQDLWLSWSVARAAPDRVHLAARDVSADRGDVVGGRGAQIRVQLEQVFDAVADGIWVLDGEARPVLVNPVAEAMTGFSRAELIGRLSHPIIHHTRPGGEPYPIEECPIHRSVFEGEPCVVEDEVFWRKDGSSFPVQYTSTPVVGRDGER